LVIPPEAIIGIEVCLARLIVASTFTPCIMPSRAIYALESKQTLFALEVDKGTTLKQAIVLSGIMASYPQIDLSKDKTGIFGKIAITGA
jgi:hypothetical protein